jgi:hypothetical protein
MKKKIIIIIGICLVVIITLFLLFIFNNDKKYIEINKSVDIDIGGYNQVIKIKSLNRDILFNEDKYIRLDMEIENKKNIDTITSLHQFILVNDNSEELTICYHEGMIDKELPDVLPNKLIANSITSGYLYCPTVLDISSLKIKVISGGKIDDNNEITYEYKDYYIDLK